MKLVQISKNFDWKAFAFNCPAFHLRRIIICKHPKLITIALTVKPIFIPGDNMSLVGPLLNLTISESVQTKIAMDRFQIACPRLRGQSS
jgi:hypothetical protein